MRDGGWTVGSVSWSFLGELADRIPTVTYSCLQTFVEIPGIVSLSPGIRGANFSGAGHRDYGNREEAPGTKNVSRRVHSSPAFFLRASGMTRSVMPQLSPES